MTLPTRRIDKTEFEKLTRELGGDMLEHRTLKPFGFNVPRPGNEEPLDAFADKGINVLLLPTPTPAIYKWEEIEKTFVILPLGKPEEDYDFAYLASCHYIDSDAVWGYTLGITGREDTFKFYFRPEIIPPYADKAVTSH